ncbi:MAG: hypothetical protein NVS3B20_17190 [Polyangiales bacterium]
MPTDKVQNERFSPSRKKFVRRALVVSLSPVALLLLSWLGQYATSSASSASSDGATETDRAAETATNDLDSEFAALNGHEEVDGSVTDAPSAPAAIEALPDGGFTIDLNLANEQELRRLPGVGAVRARAILSLKGKLGRFKSFEDLARIRGFGRATLRRLRPMIRVTPK